MAKVKYGEFVVGMSGKVGGTIHSRNKGGAYTKNWAIPTNTPSSYRTAVRALFGMFSQAWRNLTAAQIAAWNSATGNFQVIDRMGNLITLSGINLYKGLNQNLMGVGAAAISTPPMPAGTISAQIGNLTSTFTGTILTLTTAQAVPTGMAMVVEATSPQSPGVSNAQNEFRVVQSFAAAAASPHDIETNYIARFGSFPPAGSKVFARIKFINITTGESSTYSNTSAITGA